MSDLRRCVKPPHPAPYRVVMPDGRGFAVIEYAHSVESATAYALFTNGVIEVYEQGKGWRPIEKEDER
jgi:hypothetical protein